MTKRLNVIMTEEFHQEFKLYATKAKASMSTIVLALLAEEMNANRAYDDQNYAVILESERAGR